MLIRPMPALLAATVCLTLPAFFATPAAARTYERCDFDGDHCVRVTCDHDGDRCWRESEYSKNEMYRHRGRWECDRDGDRCHYVYRGKKWEPRHWEHDEDRDER